MPAFVNNRVLHLLHCWELDNLAWQRLGQPPRRLNQDLAQDLGLSTAQSASAYLRLVAVAPPADDLIGPAPAPAAAPGDSGAASGGGGGGGGSNGALAALAANCSHISADAALRNAQASYASTGALPLGDSWCEAWTESQLAGASKTCMFSLLFLHGMSKRGTDSVSTGMSLHGAVPSGVDGSRE